MDSVFPLGGSLKNCELAWTTQLIYFRSLVQKQTAGYEMVDWMPNLQFMDFSIGAEFLEHSGV